MKAKWTGKKLVAMAGLVTALATSGAAYSEAAATQFNPCCTSGGCSGIVTGGWCISDHDCGPLLTCCWDCPF